MVNKETKEMAISRLKKIEGQVRGLQHMIDSEKYCIDIINQINAARRALDQVGLLVMKRHLESCVADAIKTKGGEEKIKELVESVDKFIR
ncbi:MAG: metal-sensitive transcriptional regulator [Deltaproteobacteria bacterium]|nr:metal-sensitive transcriptional regulator [Deltaproteobacteria bacterium]